MTQPFTAQKLGYGLKVEPGENIILDKTAQLVK